MPEMPYRKVDLDQAMRNVLSQEKFAADGGLGDVEGWLNTITIENVHPNTTVAIRMKGISGGNRFSEAVCIRHRWYLERSSGREMAYPDRRW